MAELDLTAIEARAEAATPGPWGWTDTGHYKIALVRRWRNGSVWSMDVVVPSSWPDVYPSEVNATFIENARTDVPALVAEVQRLREAVGVLEETKEGEDREMRLHDRIEALETLESVVRDKYGHYLRPVIYDSLDFMGDSKMAAIVRCLATLTTAPEVPA